MCAQVDDSFGDLVLAEDEDVEQTTPIASVLPCTTPPVIDGSLSDATWEEANRFPGFIDNTSRRYAVNQTFVSVAYDADAIYIAMESPAGDTPAQDDLYAVLLRPPKATRPHVFRLTPDGALTDGAGRPIPAAAASAASQTVDGQWVVELAIRFDGLGVPAPKGKALWKANFLRWWSKPQARTSWVGQRVPDLLKPDPKEMGLMVLRTEGPGLRVEQFGRLDEGQHHFLCRFRVNDANEAVYVFTDTVDDGVFTRGAHTEKSVPGEWGDLKVTPTKAGAGQMKTADSISYSLVNKGFRIVYFRSDRFPVREAPLIEILKTSFENRKQLRITADTWGVTPDLVGKVNASISLAPKGAGTQKPIVAQATNVTKRQLSTAFPLNVLKPGVEYVVRATLTAQGGETGADEATVVYPDVSLWMNNTLGMDDIVPAPFTPVEVEGDAIRCWGREYRFASGSGFPTQIVTRGKEILGAPPALALSTTNGPIDWTTTDGRVASAKGTTASFTAASRSPVLSVESVSTVEYDGMLRVDLTITPRQPITLKALTLSIPLKAEHARYLGRTESTGAGQRARQEYGALPADGYRDSFLPFVWLGDEDRGLLWFCESARGWRPADPGAAVEVTPEADGVVTLRANIIGRETRLGEPLHLTIGLQASPVRPRPERWRQLETKFAWGPTTMDHFGYVPEMLYAWTDHLKKTKAKGKMISAYSLLNNVSTKLPEYNLFFDEWKRERSSTKGKYYMDVLSPGVKSWQDFVIWSWKLGLDRFDIDGIYYDLSWPSPTTNPDHGAYIGEDGKPANHWPIFAVREIAKRAYVLFRQHKKQTAFMAHCSSNPITLPILSFCDFALDGEQFVHILRSYTDQVSLAKWRTEFTCRQFGMMPILLPELGRSGDPDYNERTPEPTAEMMGLVYLHDAMVMVAWCHGKTLLSFQNAKMAFVEDADIEFLPYWTNGDVFSPDNAQTKVSAYRKPGACLLLMMNLDKEPTDAAITMDLKALGLQADKVRATNAVTGEACKLTGNTLTLPLKSRWLTMIELTEIEPADIRKAAP